MADFTIKRHDTLPALQATLKRDGVAIDLTTAVSVKLIMKPQAGGSVVTGTCTITTPASGLVTYNWISADTAVAGVYDLEFEITWPASKKETVPNDSEKTVDVRADLDNA